MHRHGEASCGSCGKCPIGSCPEDPADQGAIPKGWRLVGSAIGVFLLPVILAVCGAAVAGNSESMRFIGAATGLTLGLAGAIVVGKLLQDNGNSP